MREQNLCYDCAFWHSFFEKRKYKKKDYEIVNGIVYLVNNVDPGEGICYDMHCSYLLYPDNKVGYYNDTIKIGSLSPSYRRKYRNTAKFITKRLYKRLNTLPDFHCKAKGCYDRYNCMFYHPEEHEANGPFNKIPEAWVVGNEKCPHFANRNEIIDKR